MLSKYVNQPLVTLVPVAPIVFTNKLSHFLVVLPKSSSSLVSEIKSVFIATLARLSKAVEAPVPETVAQTN